MKIVNSNERIEAIKILFISALPDDQMRLGSEYDDIIKNAEISIKNKELEFLNPVLETNYGKLFQRLKDDRPNVLHFSGHGTKEGICLRNNNTGKTELLKNNELENLFEGKVTHLKLIFLNSCFSSTQAEIISKQGIYVLSFREEIDNSISQLLSKTFYLGFTAQELPILIGKAINIGCTNFYKNYTENTNILSLWYNGEEIDYNTVTIEKNVNNTNVQELAAQENIKNSLLRFNYKNQTSIVLENIKSENKFFIFSLEKKEETKFVFKVIENTLKEIESNLGYPIFEVMTFSKITSKESITDFVDKNTGHLRTKAVILCLKFEKTINLKLIKEIIQDMYNNPPATKKYPCLLFLLTENNNPIDENCIHIPHSASSIISDIVNAKNGKKSLESYLCFFKDELKAWVENEKIPLRTQDALKCFCEEYFKDIQEVVSFVSNSEKQHAYNMLMEFLNTQLGYEIKFDEQLNIKLSLCENY